MAFYDSSGKKIGRNVSCPCGSGKKFKHCCGGTISQKRQFTVPAMPKEIKRKLEIIDKRRKDFEAKHGKGRPIITTEFKDWRVVAVGNELHYGKKEKTKYFTDFLSNYVRAKLGIDWGNTELAKPFEERHQILKWYNSMCYFQMKQKPKKDGTYYTSANGSMLSWFRLAYDLYLIKHNSKLQEEILNRIRNKSQFQGARFELCAAASMIVAGFQIEFEDERDRTRKHAEFIATHPSELQIAVEAKSRHRSGVLEFNVPLEINGEDQTPKVAVERLIRKALVKDPDYPYFIFIDVNLPYSDENYQGNPWFKEMVETVEKLKAECFPNPFPANAIFFCNDPTYQEPEKVPQGNKFWCYEVPIDNPKNPLTNKKIIRHVTYSIMRRTNIPNKYPEDRNVS
jgi:hypothetical protein